MLSLSESWNIFARSKPRSIQRTTFPQTEGSLSCQRSGISSSCALLATDKVDLCVPLDTLSVAFVVVNISSLRYGVTSGFKHIKLLDIML